VAVTPSRSAAGTLAAVGTGGLVAWLALVADGLSRSDPSVPVWPLVLATAAGTAVAASRWGSPARRLHGLRALQVAASLVLVLVLRPDPGHGTGWSPFAVAFGQTLMLALVVVMPTTTSPDAVVNRVAVALLASAAVLVEHPLQDAVVRLAVTAVLAALALAGTARSWQERFPRLPAGPPVAGGGGGAAGRPGGGLQARTARDAALAAGAVVLLVPLLAATEGTPSTGGDTGRGPARTRSQGASAGLNLDDELDVTQRLGLSDRVVLRVQSPVPDFWRAGSYARWDGRTWRRDRETDGGSVMALASVRTPLQADARPQVPTSPLVQLVTVEAPTTAVVGAPRVALVETHALPLRATGDGAVTTGVAMEPGTRYRVTSERVPVTAELLRAHDPRGAAIPDDLTPYLQLPDVPDRVVELAREVTADAPTTYDAILALERWMGEHTTYTLDIPPLPDGADAVEHHLFESRRGFCEQIGTSLTVLLRTLGVPARLAVGYVPGEEAALGGEFVVRERDAHAWVEVWFPGLGWQGFDPTAEVPLAGEYDNSAAGRLRRLLERSAPVLLILGGLAVAAGAVVLAVRGARRRQARPWEQVWFRRLERVGRRRGRARRPSETMREYAAALVAGPLPDARVVEAVAALEAARFADRPPDADTRRRAETALRAARREARRRRRRRWRRGPG